MNSKRWTLGAMLALLCLACAAPGAHAAGTLTVAKSPQSGAGTIVGETDVDTPIDCGVTCEAYVDDEEVCPRPDVCSLQPQTVRLTATAATGWQLTGWSSCSGTGGCNVVMSTDRSVTASFADVGKPSVALSGPVAGSKLNGTVAFGASAADNAGVQRVEWLLDGLVVASDTSPGDGWNGSVPTAGKPHGDTVTVRARAFDVYGNVSDELPGNARSFVVDHRTGVHFEDPTPAEGSHLNVSEVQYAFAVDTDNPADTNVTFSCQINGTGFYPCNSPDTLDTSDPGQDGLYTIDIRVTDDAGPVPNTAQVQRSFVVDRQPPTLTVTTPADGSLRNSTTLTPAYSVSDDLSPAADISVDCAVDGDAGSLAPCSSFSGLAQGPHTFLARATDLAGNSSTDVSRSFTVDTLRPDTTIAAGGPSGVVRSTSANFAYTSTEAGSTFTCKLDNGPVVSCNGGSKSYSGLGQGPHTFTVRAKDPAGNVDSPPATRGWTVDTVGPNTFITSGPSGPVASTAVQFNFNSGESGGSFKCSLDNAAFTTCPSPKQYSGLGQGPHTFKVRAYDAAGNADPTSAVRSFTVDTIRPDTRITFGPSGSTSAPSAEFRFESTEPGGTFNCKLDDGPTVGCTSPKSYSGLAVGTHTFTVRARDAAGNFDSPPATRGWTITP